MCAGGATERFLQERKKLLCLSFFGQCKEIRSRTDSVSFMVAIYLGFMCLAGCDNSWCLPQGLASPSHRAHGGPGCFPVWQP